jgi:diketogulonate reductase-like aldo/keto reductase
MNSARDDGLVEAVGLSNVTLAHLQHASRFTDVACVQNAYHLADRRSQPVLDECVRRGIAFVPFSSLGSGSPGRSVLGAPPLTRTANRLGCAPAQVALAWALQVAPNVLVIPGTSSSAHLREIVATGAVHLDAQAMADLAAASKD